MSLTDISAVASRRPETRKLGMLPYWVLQGGHVPHRHCNSTGAGTKRRSLPLLRLHGVLGTVTIGNAALLRAIAVLLCDFTWGPTGVTKLGRLFRTLSFSSKLSSSGSNPTGPNGLSFEGLLSRAPTQNRYSRGLKQGRGDAERSEASSRPSEAFEVVHAVLSGQSEAQYSQGDTQLALDFQYRL